MNIGSYIAGIFGGKARTAPPVHDESKKAVTIREVPVLLPIPLNFDVVRNQWEATDAQNLENFLLTETGKKFQQHLMLKYGLILKDGMSGEIGGEQSLNQARGVLMAINLAKELANPVSYVSPANQALHRANSKWGAGMGLVKEKAPETK